MAWRLSDNDRFSTPDGTQSVIDRRDTDGGRYGVGGRVVTDGQHQVAEITKGHGHRVLELGDPDGARRSTRRLECNSLRRVYSPRVDLGVELKANRDFDHGSKDVRPVGIKRDLGAVRQTNSMQ